MSIATLEKLETEFPVLEKFIESKYKFRFTRYASPKELYSSFPIHGKLELAYINKEKSNPLLGAYNYLKHVCGWFPANPNNHENINQLESVFFKMKQDTHIKYSSFPTANLQTNLENNLFEFDNVVDEHDDIAVIGVRGVGKTAFLNYWLNVNTKRREKDNFIWFRIDATKVYKIYFKNIKHNSGIVMHNILFQYLVFHTAYVVQMYSGRFLNSPPQDKSDIFVRFMNTYSQDDDFVAALSALNDRFTVISSQFAVKEEDLYEEFDTKAKGKRFATDISIKFIESLFSDRLNIFYRHAILIYNKLIEYVNENNITTAILVDGIDNMSWAPTDPVYIEMCTSVSFVFQQVSQSFLKSKRIVIARPEALAETGFQLPSESLGSQNTNTIPGEEIVFYPCVVRSPNPRKILETKFNAALESEIFKNRLNYLSSRIDKSSTGATAPASAIREEVKKIQALVFQILSVLVKYVEERFKDASIFHHQMYFESLQDIGEFDKSSMVVDVLFDNDLRGFIQNLLLAAYSIRILDLRGTNTEADSIKIQSVFLSGRSYFNTSSQLVEGSRHNYSYVYDVIPNIFWFSEDDVRECRDIWHGTLGTSLLVFASCSGKFSYGEAIDFLAKYSRYSEACAREVLAAFVAFGLIDTSLKPDSNGKYDLKGRFAITNKGLLLMSAFICNIEMCYFYLFDTPFASEYVKRVNFRLYRTFDFSTLEEQFFDASFNSVSIFVKHFLNSLQIQCDLIEIVSEKSLYFKNDIIKKFHEIAHLTKNSYAQYLDASRKSSQKFENSIRNLVDLD